VRELQQVRTTPDRADFTMIANVAHLSQAGHTNRRPGIIASVTR
jgi:hypothetical protein